MRAVYWAAVRGLARRNRPSALPDAGLTLDDVAVDLDHLAAYDRVCGLRLSDPLPATYPHVLAFPLTLGLLTRPDFPLPIVGLVHLANRIEVLAPLRVTDRFALRVRAEALRPHERGTQFDIVAEAHAAGATVWRERSTYLRRDRARRAPGERPPAPAPPPGTAIWELPGDTGRRYARVSGDRNPIHTSRLVARLSGFPRRIAHGMWTAARCLAALEGRLPEAYTMDVRFQGPVPLPGRVAFAATAEPGGWRISVHDPRSGRPHLHGRLS